MTPEILPYIDFSGPQSGECPVSTEGTQPLVKWPEIKKKSGFEKVDLPRVAVGHSSYQGQSVYLEPDHTEKSSAPPLTTSSTWGSSTESASRSSTPLSSTLGGLL